MIERIKGLDNSQVQSTVKAIRKLINKYNWQDRVIHPYSFGINVVKFLDPFDDFMNYTYISKCQMIDELNGFINIVNKWIEQENEPKVTIIYNGRKITVRESLAELLKEATEEEKAGA